VIRFLRNLDLECVICHEYIVDATAVDCGEGHTFCRWGGHQRPGYRSKVRVIACLWVPMGPWAYN
jgi:hypothetical protein